ncbi:hypothetical protein GCM10010169_33970 [Micromonospora fulviviridis]|uniref:hypothetical protein n=1 Tax=Micromonospora fulviviridis TaxID=47860 RepID=UPI0016681684|nr:hypothetical protein [Micromonospora fulviviridis]GGR86948.1 hypothetical protein GCM10010169_33970 [Micromonospora fulviviridis]
MMRDRAGLLDRVASLEQRPRVPQVRLALSEAEFRLALIPGTPPEEAIARLRRSIGHDPFSAKAHLHLGRALHRESRRWAALAAYRRAYALAPGTARAPLLMAYALLDLGRPEREVAAALLAAVAGGDASAIDAAIGEFDALAAGAQAPDGAARPARRRRQAGAVDLTADLPVEIWRALLAEQVSRKPPNAAWARKYLRAAPGGDEGPSEIATAAVLMLACGTAPSDVREALAEAGDRLPGSHPAVRMLLAVLDLGDCDRDAFTAEVVRLVGGRIVPAEAVCALHFTWFGPDRLDAVAAIRMLDEYPDELRALPCFAALRIAILDAYARRAWTAERFDEAGLLWRATIPVDPFSVAVAVDLALLATRTRSAAYGPAWERAAELLYLHAAGHGDPGHLVDDRVALHRSLAEQSLRQSGGDDPSVEEITSWIAAGDGAEVWLRHWDLYYLNVRLRFRSPWHVLGVEPGAGPEALAAARDLMLRHLTDTVGAQEWAGARTFCELARQRVTRACAEAASGDAHFEREQPAADRLLDEAKRRVLVLHKISLALRGEKSARHRRLLCAVVRHEFALPLDRLHDLCVEQEILTGDVRLAEILEQSAAEFAAGWEGSTPAGLPDPQRLLADVEAVVRAVPDRPGLRVAHARLLMWTGRTADAYATAAEAVLDGGDEAHPLRARIRELLTRVIDDVAWADIGATEGADLVAIGHDAMARYPRSVAPVITVARGLDARGDPDRAVAVLSDRLGAVDTDVQTRALRGAVRGLHGGDAAVQRHVRDLWRRAATRISEDRSSGGVRAAIAHLDHAVALARARGLGRDVGRLEEEIARLRRVTEATEGAA